MCQPLSRDSSVGIVTWLRTGRPSVRGSIPDTGNIFISSPKCPDRLWDPPSLPGNHHRVFSSQEYSGRSVKQTCHHHLSPKLETAAFPQPPPPPYTFMPGTRTTSHLTLRVLSPFHTPNEATTFTDPKRLVTRKKSMVTSISTPGRHIGKWRYSSTCS
jgi:hypothetical protein